MLQTTFKVTATIAVAVALVFGAYAVTATTAHAITLAELVELFISLGIIPADKADVARSALSTQSGGSTTGISCTTFTFTRNHSQGDSGGEVMEIQKFLNADASTQLASGTDAGSPGNETSFFGPVTKAAVIKFQDKYASEILAPVGLVNGTGFWGPSSRAKANALNANCNVTTTPPVTPPGTPGAGLSVSGAVQPANALAPENAAKLPFTKFTVVNNGTVAQTINSVLVQRTGGAANTGFASVVLLDRNNIQIGNERVLNSNDQATIGADVVLQPGESHMFTVAANMDADLDQEAGQVASFAVIGINTSAPVSGSLPITGALHTLNGTLAIGSVTGIRGVEDPNAASTEEVGTTNYTFTGIRLTAGSAENVRLMSIRFDQSGSADAGDLQNVRLIIDGVEYTPTVSGDTYTFSFGSGILINEGFSKELALKGDIVGGANRTVAFDIEEFTDIHVVGETFGYGITVTDGGAGFTTTEPVYDAFVVTISAGAFNSVSRSNDAPAANIGIQNQDEILGAFTVDIKGEPINVQTMKFDITPDAGSTSRQITNVTLVDQNGLVLAGPVDSIVLATSGAVNADALTFSSVDLQVGVTTVFVKGQLDADWVLNDTLAISTQPSTDWTSAKGQNTGDAATLPSAIATANTMTVKTGSLTATTLTSNPPTRSIVAGVNDYIFATISLDAGNSGEDVRVTALVIEDTLGDAADNAADIDNVEVWANLTGGTTPDSVRGDVFETRIADAEQLADSGATDETLSITLDTQITVKKNTSVDIAIIADLASGATTGDTHTISLDTDAGDVTAVGLTSGNTVTVTPTGAGQTQTVAASGTLTTSVDSSSPVAKLMLDDTVNEQTVAVFRLASSNVEDLDVDSLLLTTGNTAVQKYVFYNGSTKLGEKTNAGAPEFFLNDGQLVIPANGNVLVTVKAVMRDIDGTTVANGASVAVVLDNAETTGKSSGTAVDSGTDRTAATHKVYESYPSFAFDNNGVSTVLGANANYLAAKIIITNNGNEDITFATTSSLQINFEISGTLSTSVSVVKAIETDTGNTLDTVNMGATTGSTSADIAFATNTLTIPAGQTEEIQIRVNTGGLTTDGNTLQAWLSDDADANLQFAIDAAGDFNEGTKVFRGDIFGPVHVNPS